MTKTQIQTEALHRATTNQSLANYPEIYRGFMDKGISEDDIRPRENIFTYHAWKALGRCVKKGEHGVKVCTYVPVKDKEGNVKRKNGKPAFMRRLSTVFHVSQTKKLGE